MRDYDALRVEHRDLAIGELFQPWVPMEHWRGDEVPIRGLSGELAWLLRVAALPDRTALDPILVLLDQAMIRCGI